jgi:mRNA interferase MazF
MKRFEVWLARLDPSEGSEMRKTRPVVIVSPDEMNLRLLTVLAAPLTAGGFIAPFRVPCRFAGVSGQVALDHVRSLSKPRCLRCLGSLDTEASKEVLTQMRAMFEE